jgi:hypothetical protein
MSLRLSNIALLAAAGLWLTSGAAIATDSPPPHPAKVIVVKPAPAPKPDPAPVASTTVAKHSAPAPAPVASTPAPAPVRSSTPAPAPAHVATRAQTHPAKPVAKVRKAAKPKPKHHAPRHHAKPKPHPPVSAPATPVVPVAAATHRRSPLFYGVIAAVALLVIAGIVLVARATASSLRSSGSDEPAPQREPPPPLPEPYSPPAAAVAAPVFNNNHVADLLAPSSPDPTTVEIVLWHGYMRSRFVAQTLGTDLYAVAESPAFRRWRGTDEDDPSDAALEAHQTLIDQLRAAGWQPTVRGTRWYEQTMSVEPPTVLPMVMEVPETTPQPAG